MTKQLLDAAMTDIKFTQSHQVKSNSGKPSSEITFFDKINFDIRHQFVQ